MVRLPAAKDQFFRTKLCPHHDLGKCRKKGDCFFAHGVDELCHLPDLRKTKLCQDFIKTGSCGRGNSCMYAHNEKELRFTDGYWKTDFCKHWKLGGCSAGVYCRHAHGAEELRSIRNKIQDHIEAVKKNKTCDDAGQLETQGGRTPVELERDHFQEQTVETETEKEQTVETQTEKEQTVETQTEKEQTRYKATSGADVTNMQSKQEYNGRKGFGMVISDTHEYEGENEEIDVRKISTPDSKKEKKFKKIVNETKRVEENSRNGNNKHHTILFVSEEDVFEDDYTGDFSNDVTVSVSQQLNCDNLMPSSKAKPRNLNFIPPPPPPLPSSAGNDSRSCQTCLDEEFFETDYLVEDSLKFSNKQNLSNRTVTRAVGGHNAVVPQNRVISSSTVYHEGATSSECTSNQPTDVVCYPPSTPPPVKIPMSTVVNSLVNMPLSTRPSLSVPSPSITSFSKVARAFHRMGFIPPPPKSIPPPPPLTIPPPPPRNKSYVSPPSGRKSHIPPPPPPCKPSLPKQLLKPPPPPVTPANSTVCSTLPSRSNSISSSRELAGSYQMTPSTTTAISSPVPSSVCSLINYSSCCAATTLPLSPPSGPPSIYGNPGECLSAEERFPSYHYRMTRETEEVVDHRDYMEVGGSSVCRQQAGNYLGVPLIHSGSLMACASMVSYPASHDSNLYFTYMPVGNDQNRNILYMPVMLWQHRNSGVPVELQAMFNSVSFEDLSRACQTVSYVE